MCSHRIVHDLGTLERAEMPLSEVSPKTAIEQLIQGKVEACSEYTGRVIASRFHPFIAALHSAFADHRPLILSPDMFWLLIAQGFALHVNQQPEKYGSQFVRQAEKSKITVIRHDFIKGSPENPWETVFEEFSRHIRAEIGEDHHARIVVRFSTTGPIEKAANEIVLMESMKNYFQYEVYTRCGIPQVALEGTDDDWVKLREQAESLGAAYELSWWTSRLLPTIDAIIATVRGSENVQLWRNIYKWRQVSGGDAVTGWILDFFPYLQVEGRREQNWTILSKSSDPLGWVPSVQTGNLPGSLTAVPFIWDYFGRQLPMEFLAGFTSYSQDIHTLAVRPKIGWAVREAPDHA